MAKVDYHRNALRILFILVRGSRPYTGEPVEGYDRVFWGETKVQALDFRMRHPDSLADELSVDLAGLAANVPRLVVPAVEDTDVQLHFFNVTGVRGSLRTVARRSVTA